MIKILLMLELSELEIGMSIRRWRPPNPTAGLHRVEVKGKRRVPLPPAKIIQATRLIGDRFLSFGINPIKKER